MLEPTHKVLDLLTAAQQPRLQHMPHPVLRLSAKAAGVQEAYRQALDVLLLAEESFQCCKNDLLRYVDNQGLLFMDIVWCAGTFPPPGCRPACPLEYLLYTVHLMAVHTLKVLWLLNGVFSMCTVCTGASFSCGMSRAWPQRSSAWCAPGSA